MKGSFSLLAVCLLVTLAYTGARGNLFSFPCPPGCAQSTCTSLGCFQCQPGFHMFYSASNRISICLRSCPEGYYVNPIGGCTQCGISNCKACRDRRTCVECDRRYELDNFGGCVRSRIG